MVRAMLRKAMQVLGLIALVWLVAAGAAEAVSRAHTPRGRMVDIGGRRLRLVCEGPVSAAPTVWMEAGAFSGAADFAAIQERLARKGLRSCAYDRAGMGFSDAGPALRDGDAIAADLDRLIAASGERGPFILMAHSMGGLYVRQYAGSHPDKVAGVVLIEAVTPELMGNPQVAAFFHRFLTLARLNAFAGTLGLTKPGYFIMVDRIGLPPAAAREKKRGQISGKQARAALSEVEAWGDAARQAKAAGNYDPATPIAVVTANYGVASPFEEARRLPAARSKAGSFDTVKGASHASILGFGHNEAVVLATLRVAASATGAARATQPSRLEGP
jgi:pimeloyl-ACP methyl ester carboxylesterase